MVKRSPSEHLYLMQASAPSAPAKSSVRSSNSPTTIPGPYKLYRDAADDWIDQAIDIYTARSDEGFRRRTIWRSGATLKKSVIDLEDRASLDGLIEMALDLKARDGSYHIEHDPDGRPFAENWVRGRVPHYTSDSTVAAVLLDPEGPLPRPASTDERSTIAFCIAALSARWGLRSRV